MEHFRKTILITGGAGFIGCHVVKRFVRNYPDCLILNFDKLTYAGNLENLSEIENENNYRFLKGDIVNEADVSKVFADYQIDSVIHLAAESHVDRSISNPMAFIMTNIVGTVNLLNAAKLNWAGKMNDKRFYHISTDEVFGSLGETGFFTETTPYYPRSPYSAAKASSDHLVRAYYHTFDLPVVVTNCSNNYGPNQFPEKLIPLMIHNIKNKKPLPVYGKGDNVRDWLYVEDHAEAIDLVFHQGTTGETYNIGGNNEWKNIDIVRHICRIMDDKLNRIAGESEELITFVTDRPGHDLRYAIDASRIKKELGWSPKHDFEKGIEKTIDWYLTNTLWLENVTTG
ncbi:MAG: dTDP-glucose 4,6-dehydratase, partial [Bacteroidetes bacterium]|nr:dTDP-glucose 4,6-dehydratase [Bacteroidota bacterium]